MILVTGATGHLGKETLDFLLAKTNASQIAAFVRSSEKAQLLKEKGIEIRIGDYDNYPSLVQAFAGIEKLFFVSGNDIPKRDQQHVNVINAAKEAGVKHIVYTSFQRQSEKDSSPIAIVAKTHLLTEKLLKESGLKYTILKNNMYMEGISMFIGNKVLETGTIFLPAGNGKASYALRTDMAEASTNILLSGGHENKAYEFSGTQSYSFTDVADILTELSGKKISYIDPAPENFTSELAKGGVPASVIGVIAAFCEGIKQGEFDLPDTAMEKILGRKPVALKDYLKKTYSL